MGECILAACRCQRLAASFHRCRVALVGHTLHSPSLSAYPTKASLTNCTTNTHGGFSGNDCPRSSDRRGRRKATLNPHDACGIIRFVGNYQLQAGRPSGSGAKVRYGMRSQRYARLNLDLHAMTEAPESQTHVVDRVGRVLWHATNHNAVAQKTKSLSRGGPTRLKS